MQRVGLEVVRPQMFDVAPGIRRVEDSGDKISQAKHDFLYIAAQRLGALRDDMTVNQVAAELNLLKMGITRRREKKVGGTAEEYSQYFAHYFHDTSLLHIADKDVNPFTLEAYKANGMCISVNGYAVWFAEEHGELRLYFGKEPVRVN